MKMALNVKQEKFIQNIVKGMSQRQAYKDAYNAKYSEKSIDEKASTLFNSEKVQERYKELLKQLEDKSIMSAKDRMKWLTDVINGNVKDTVYNLDGANTSIEKIADINTKIKALDTLNKMSGEYTTKIESNVDFNIRVELDD